MPPASAPPPASDNQAAGSTAQWHVSAAVATWLVPGLGHYLLGQRRRGIILAVSISLLWLGGLAIGGISSVDRTAHPAWFLGQMLVAPSVVVEYYHTRLRSAGRDEPVPGESPAYAPSFARTNEQGVLYTAVAGMLNLLAIIDVLYRDPRDPRHRGGMPPPEELDVPAPARGAGAGEAT